MRVELLNRTRCSIRVELANATFEHLEIFHNRQRRHSSLGILSSIEDKFRHAENTARDLPTSRVSSGHTKWRSRSSPTGGTLSPAAGHQNIAVEYRFDAVALVEWRRCRQSTGDDDLAGAQPSTGRSQLPGEPCNTNQRIT